MQYTSVLATLVVVLGIFAAVWQVAIANLLPGDMTTLLRCARWNLLVLWGTLVLLTGLWWTAARGWLSAQQWGWLAFTLLSLEMSVFAISVSRPFPVERLYDPNNALAVLDLPSSEIRVDGYRAPPAYHVATLKDVRNGDEHSALTALLDLGQRGRNLLAAGYYPTDEESQDPDLELVRQSGPKYLYQHVANLPRIYAAPAITICHIDQVALHYVGNDAFRPFQQAVVSLSQEGLDRVSSLPEIAEAEAVVFAKYRSYRWNSLVAEVDVDRPVMLVFSEMYYAGWQATVDGEPAPIWKVNYAFRGVIVDTGKHLIEMRFWSREFVLGLAMTISTLGLIATVSFWRVIFPYKRENLGSLFR